MVRIAKITSLIVSTLILSTYFLLTSSWLYLNIIIPKIENLSGLKISASSINIKPWEEIRLKNLTVEDKNKFISRINELSIKYQSLPLLNNKIIINELTLTNPQTTLDLSEPISKQNSTETSNLKKGLYPEIGYEIELKKLSIVDGGILLRTNPTEDIQQNISIRNISLEVREFSSLKGGNIKSELTATLGDTNSPKYEVNTNGMLSFKDSIQYSGESTLAVSRENSILAQLTHNGTIDIDHNKTNIEGEINSSKLELDNILTLFATKNHKEETSEDNSYNFIANLRLNIDNLTYKELKITKATSELQYSNDLLSGNNIALDLNDAPLKGSFILSTLQPTHKPTIDLEVRNIELHPLVKSFNEEASKNLYGKIKRLTFRIKNSWDPKDKGLKERDGDLRVKFKNLKIPAYLQDTPPINLIFLPVKALDYATDKIGKALLPSSITKATETVDIENRSGQIEFDEAQIQGMINGKGIDLRNTTFNSYILPTFHFHGNIDFNEDLNLNIGIEVLKIPVPLPVTGSLSVPLPDLVGFLPAVARSLGTSFTNITSILDSEEEKEEEFFK